MRSTSIVVSIALIGCGEVASTPDAPPPDATPDAPPDAPPGCPKTLLTGGTPIEAQGWAVNQSGPATVSYQADYVRLETSTATGATTSGQLLMRYQGALPAPPFRFQVVLLVERANTHNTFDAGAAILGSINSSTSSVALTLAI